MLAVLEFGNYALKMPFKVKGGDHLPQHIKFHVFCISFVRIEFDLSFFGEYIITSCFCLVSSLSVGVVYQ